MCWWSTNTHANTQFMSVQHNMDAITCLFPLFQGFFLRSRVFTFTVSCVYYVTNKNSNDDGIHYHESKDWIEWAKKETTEYQILCYMLLALTAFQEILIHCVGFKILLNCRIPSSLADKGLHCGSVFSIYFVHNMHNARRMHFPSLFKLSIWKVNDLNKSSFPLNECVETFIIEKDRIRFFLFNAATVKRLKHIIRCECVESQHCQ